MLSFFHKTKDKRGSYWYQSDKYEWWWWWDNWQLLSYVGYYNFNKYQGLSSYQLTLPHRFMESKQYKNPKGK